jgi:hypothetical protein
MGSLKVPRSTLAGVYESGIGPFRRLPRRGDKSGVGGKAEVASARSKRR